jgi:hypothetical protein
MGIRDELESAGSFIANPIAGAHSFAADKLDFGSDEIKRLVDPLGLGSSLFGGGGDTNINFSPKGFEAGGLTGTVTPEGVDLSRSPELAGILSNLSGEFGAQAETLGELLSQVEPGFGRLTETAVSALEQRRRAAVGNLRENLARRRIGGSSFAASALGRTEAEFAKQESEVRAKSFLAELDAKTRLITQQAQARQAQFDVLLKQGNFEAALGAEMATSINSLLGNIALAESQLAASEAQAKGQAIGTGLSFLAIASGV